MGRDDDVVASFRTDYPPEEQAKARAFGEDIAKSAAKGTDSLGGLAGSLTLAAGKFLIVHEAASRLWRTVSGAVEAVGAFAREGNRANDLLSNLSVSTDEAGRVLSGLVSQTDLARLANEAQQRGLDLTAQQFGAVANAAGIMSDRLGTDVVQQFGAVTDAVTLANARTLKQLGIYLDIDRVLAGHAAAIGKTTKELTEAEQQTAKQNAVLEELARLQERAQFTAGGAGDAFDQLAVSFSNLRTEAAQLVDRSFAVGYWLEFLRDRLRDVKEAYAPGMDQQQYISFLAQQKVSAEAAAKAETHLNEASMRRRLAALAGGRGAPKGAAAPGGFAPLPLGEGEFGPGTEAGAREFYGETLGKQRATELALERQHNEGLQEILAGRAAIQQHFADQQLAAMQEQADRTMFIAGAIAQGIGTAIGAAITGQKGFGAAMKDMLRSTAASIGQQALIRALMEVALAYAEPWAAPRHWAAAAFFGKVAAVALPLAAVMGSGGGGGAGGGAGAGAGAGAAGPTTTGFGTTRGEAPTNITINISGVVGDQASVGRAVGDALQAAVDRGYVGTSDVGGRSVITFRS